MSYQSVVRRRRIMGFLKVIIGLSIAVLIIIYGDALLNGLLDFLGI